MSRLLPFIIFFLPFSFALNPSKDIDLSLIRLLTFILFFIWIIYSFKQKKIVFGQKLIFWLWITFFILVSISFLWAENPIWSLRKAFFLISFFPFYLFTSSFYSISYEKQEAFSYKKLFSAFFFSAIFVAFWGWLQFFSSFLKETDLVLTFWIKIQSFFIGKNVSQTVQNFPSFFVNIENKNFLRAFGPFPDPHIFGAFLTLSLPFGFYFYQKKHSPIILFAILFVFLASLFSFSRTIYWMLGGEVFWALILFFSQKQLSKIFFLIFFLILPPFLFFNNPFKNRLFSSFNLQEGSISGRLVMWEKALQSFQEKPLTGVGLGNFPLFVKPTTNFREPIYAHNLFLDFLAEVGIFSLPLLISIFLLPLLSNLISLSSEKRILAIFFSGFLIYALFEQPFFSLHLYPLFLIFSAL